ncbi:hypothetical protein DVH05_005004 [Phytophthora capsici]|nr:hypothetical protein DVH05_005004 [Phytophthora capsici]
MRKLATQGRKRSIGEGSTMEPLVTSSSTALQALDTQPDVTTAARTIAFGESILWMSAFCRRICGDAHSLYDRSTRPRSRLRASRRHARLYRSVPAVLGSGMALGKAPSGYSLRL